MSAQYLIRFDDMCPTMNWDVWRQVEDILLTHRIKPILAVVPDNEDADLKISEPNASFWNEVRDWQARGWTIGLHGYRHASATRDAGLMGNKPLSEFSGLSRAEQESKIRFALNILEGERVMPEIWIAPFHSFDRTTLDALSAVGLRCISDGFAFYPHLDSRGFVWIPQQLWRLRTMPFGLWTICLHLNRWTQMDVDSFRSDVEQFAPSMTDLPSILARYRSRKRSVADALFSRGYQILFRSPQWVRHIVFR